MESSYGFFFSRKRLDFGVQSTTQSSKRLIEYQATSQTIATVLSSKMATLHELDTVYGVEDLWILIEISAVDRHNASLMSSK